jgi:GTPase
VDAVADAAAGLLARVLAGERAAIARAITAVENSAAIAAPLMAGVRAHAGRAHVLGITGAPGAGKSTLVSALLGALLECGQQVAVVAIDPSSPRTGGAVLGDRIRMGEFGADRGVFIRSLASRGQVGGLTQTCAAVVDLLDAAKFDTVIVETVGAGQSEVEVATLADSTIVVCPPGLGDDVQAAKAGILEIADVLVVSKADLPGAERALGELREMVALRAGDRGRIPVLAVAAADRTGIAALLDAVHAHAAATGVARRLRAAPQEVGDVGPEAARVARMYRHDRFLRHAGIEFVAGAAGTATLRMPIAARHLNFNGTCHGGALFTLADGAFGLACNSQGVLAAAIDCHVTYQVAVRDGDVLKAHAVEASRSKRVCVYRVDVVREHDQKLVSTFTGTAYITGHPNEPLPLPPAG